MIGYITDAKKPTMGNAYNATRSLLVNNPMLNVMIAKTVNQISTLLLSMIFNNNNPSTPPAVINPQK